MTTSAVELLATELYNKLMTPKTSKFKIIKVSQTSIAIDGDRIQNTVSNDRATPLPTGRHAQRQLLHTAVEPVEEQDKKEGETVRQNTAEEIGSARWKYAVDRIMRHVGEADNLLYVELWYSYTSADDKVEPPKHISKRFITHYLRRLNKKNEVRQRCGQRNPNRRWKVPK